MGTMMLSLALALLGQGTQDRIKVPPLAKGQPVVYEVGNLKGLVSTPNVVVFRRKPADAAEEALGLEDRERKLKEKGFVAFEVPGVHAYADPSLLTTPEMKALTTLLKSFAWPTEGAAIHPDQLGKAQFAALSTTLAASPFVGTFKTRPLDGPTRIATQSTATLTLEVDGHRLDIPTLPCDGFGPKVPVALPKGIQLPKVNEAMTVEWLGHIMPSKIKDERIAAAFAAFQKKRDELRQAFMDRIGSVAKAAYLIGDVKPNLRRISDLPPGLGAAFTKTVSGGYRAFGYETREEALDALSRGTVVGLSFRANIIVTDPENKNTLMFGLQTVRL